MTRWCLRILLLSVIANPSSAAEIRGRVIAVEGNTVQLAIEGPVKPIKGDRVEVSTSIGTSVFPVGIWEIESIGEDAITAIEVAADAAADVGMDAIIHSKAGTPPGQQATSPPGEGETAAGIISPSDGRTIPAVRHMTTRTYELFWTDKGSGADVDFAVYRPTAIAGFYPIGDVVVTGPWLDDRYAVPTFPTILIASGTLATMAPIDYRLIWTSAGSGSQKPFSLWKPVPPEGFQCLGQIGSDSLETKPPLLATRCVPNECARLLSVNEQLWTDEGSGADRPFGAWRGYENVLVGRADHTGTPDRVFGMNADCLRQIPVNP